METEEKINRTLKMIHSVLDGRHVFETWYSLPYADNENGIDIKIGYKIKKVKIWKTKDDDECLYEGTIYIEPLEIMLGQNDEWETMYGEDDVSQSVWDDLGEEVGSKILHLLPHVCLDYDYDFRTLNDSFYS